ncbi:MAG: hypothetical protein AMS19_06025 [Gemmatimonas sp. SG8_23]|nr:MAG: hypothetical protein AMS19_06025 [Gemmatimonas sp. SG8_23]
MSYGRRGQEQDVAAAYETLNASYRLMDEYMRAGQRIAEQMWMPWMRPFLGADSPFIPPEEWVRAYGSAAMAWMSAAQAWSSRWGLTPPPYGGAQDESRRRPPPKP